MEQGAWRLDIGLSHAPWPVHIPQVTTAAFNFFGVLTSG